MRGDRAKSLREENLPKRGSPIGPPKTSVRFPFVTQSSLPVYLSEVFGGPLGDPLGGRFVALGDSALLSLMALTLDHSPRWFPDFWAKVAMDHGRTSRQACTSLRFHSAHLKKSGGDWPAKGGGAHQEVSEYSFVYGSKLWNCQFSVAPGTQLTLWISVRATGEIAK